MDKYNRRFDDTTWGSILRFWPIILLLLSIGGFVWGKLYNHEGRLATIEQIARDIKDDITEIKGDVKALRRK